MVAVVTRTLTEIKNEFEPYYFDKKAANRVIRFFETKLCHVIGDKSLQNFKLESWQYRMLRRFYGWKHKITGLRKYIVLYLEIPRKNGKSIIAAGLALYHCDADNEQSARVVCFALNEDQAREAVFDVAKGMVENNPILKSRFSVYRNSMAVWESNSSFKLLSGSIKGKHGKNLSAMIGDEVHEWESREAVDALRTSMGVRSQPVEIYLTTAGFDKNSFCYELHDYAKRIKEGVVIDPTFLGVIYSAKEPEDNKDGLWWTKEEVWKKANPNLGVSVRLDFLRRECEKAIQLPSYENTFKRLHLNIWTEQDSVWMPIDKWDACRNEEFDYQELLGKPCFGGVDLSSTIDISAAALLFPPWKGFNKYTALFHFWVPEENIAIRKKRDRVPYDMWVNQGFIEATPGATVDYDYITNKFVELGKIYDIRQVAIDRWNATQFATNLSGRGFEVGFVGQGYGSLSAPTKELSALILSKKLQYKINPPMRWMIRNVAIEQDAAGNIKVSKKKSKERVDGAAALVNAISCAIVDANGRSVYEDSDIRTI